MIDLGRSSLLKRRIYWARKNPSQTNDWGEYFGDYYQGNFTGYALLTLFVVLLVLSIPRQNQVGDQKYLEAKHTKYAHEISPIGDLYWVTEMPRYLVRFPVDLKLLKPRFANCRERTILFVSARLLF